MGREDDRTILTERTNEGTDLDELVRIETCGRFIEDEQLGVAKQGLGETDTLTIAFAEFTDVLMLLRRQADTVNEGIDICHLTFVIGHLRHELEVLGDIHLFVERVVLRKIAYAGGYGDRAAISFP